MSLYIFLFLLFSVVTNAEIVLVSWNIKDFGKSRNAEEITAIAKHIRHADILVIQEVVAKDPGGVQAVARLADQLNRMGAKWDYRVSDPTQSTSSKKSERYAFLWKTSRVSLTGGSPRLIAELSNTVEREPYMIQFKVNTNVLTILNYHACTHTKDFPERQEIKAISTWLVSRKYENVVWAGDMNLQIDDEAFQSILKTGYKSVLRGEKTSLRKKCKAGEYLSNAEDNILHSNSIKVHWAKVIDFVANRCSEVEELQLKYSDHLPIGFNFIIN
jgi:deoxyribonuclease-1-like protein